MTDKEIIKALECCSTSSAVQCHDCPYCGNNYEKHCAFVLAKDALDLINRQQAEIERLTKETMNMAVTIETCQAEEVKEFAERLKSKLYIESDNFNSVVTETDIDNLVKEMVGDTE